VNAATVGESLHFGGVGLHTGEAADITIHPARQGMGICFDVEGTHIPATAEYASESQLATVVGRNGKQISTVEHVLSALFAYGVTDAEIAVSGPEIPILDGSAKPYVDAIEATGLRTFDEPRALFAPREAMEFREEDRVVIILPSSEFRVRFIGDYPEPIGTHYFDAVITPEFYRTEVAGARTFAFLRDVEAMRARGLARGGSLDNALVYDEEGPMQTLQWPNEVVRHKVLDLIGDFALLGAWPQCEVIAIKSGHAMHTRVINELRNRG
jgi:UDP-3-O-[3-hydroxymyristoyl] N-acetylglucosamine deacetylase